MPAATRRALQLSDAQLEELMALTSHADSVELKLTVPDTATRSTVAGLGMDPLEAQIRQVYFFDTPDLRLNSHGVVVRARRVQGRGDDTVVKLRPIVPDQLPPSVRKAKGMVVEVDAMPGGYICSASFKGALDTPQAKQVAAGERPIRKLFSKPQRAFYQQHAPEGLGLDDLTSWGRSPCSSSSSPPRTCGGGWWPSCGCTRTGSGSWSCRPSAPQARPSRSPPRRGRSWPIGASTCTASSTPRPRPPWTTSPRTSRKSRRRSGPAKPRCTPR